MTDMNDRNHDIESGVCGDPSLDAIAARLDAWGSGERSAPEGLEARVLAAIAETVAPMPILLPARTPWWRSGTARIAAGVALLGSAAVAVYVTQHGAGQTASQQPVITAVASVENRITSMLEISELASNDAFEDSLASIELWVDAIGSEADDTWQAGGFSHEWFGEGAL